MITVTNSADTAKVLIAGDIGESFWGDGFTFANFKEQITGDYSNIEIEIKSNGGDGFEALAIYDELKNSPARVKVKIVGATASAGTIIAMGGDEIEITENAGFLIHRGSTIAMGNIDDLEKAADMLEQFDNKLLNLYQKRTGKRKTQIENLMKEDRWLKATEAVEWGFADKIVKSKKQILNKAEMDTTKIKEILKVETDELIESAVTNLIDKAAKVDELQAIVDQHTAAEAAAHETEITNYVTDAVTAGKVTEAVKDSLINLAKTDFEAVKNIVEAAKPAPLSNHVEEGQQEPAKMTAAEAKSVWNKYAAKNALSKWRTESPEEYENVKNIMRGIV